MKKFSRRFATRRDFLLLSAAFGALAKLNRNSFGQSAAASQQVPSTTLAKDPERPQFHLLPARNWMNDPNGPIYYNGKYHMFFQYNPLAAVWGDMSWNHAVSDDMLHWTHLPLALTPVAGSADSFGVFSGSAIQAGKRVYVVYTGTRESTPEMATIRDGSDKIQESQCLAWSDDPLLVIWTRADAPIVPRPPDGLNITGFRDPSAWKQGDWYYMTVGSGIAKTGGCVLLYRSENMRKWEYLHKLIEGEWNGKPTANPCDDGEMWECPEFFALDGGHVLIYSTLGKVFWQSGTLDEGTMKFQTRKTGLLDLDAFYAPKTQLDAKGRRILWGWIPERRSEEAMRKAGWSGMMSLPRVMNLEPDGTLRLQVLPEVAALRHGVVPHQESRAGVQRTLAGGAGELLCIGSKNAALQLILSDGAKEVMLVRYLPERHVFAVDSHEIALQPEDAPTLHAFIDGSVIELILSQRIGYTKRFYYEGPAPDIKASATGVGVTMNAWKIAPISNDRLTTPARTA